MIDFVGYIDSEGKIFDGTFEYEGRVGPIGPQGPQGYTPQRGVDYWTDEDKAYVVAEATSLINGKIEEYNANAAAKTQAFNDNATSKTNTFNSNASDKTTTFNNNASSKTTDYNDNASTKTTNFNDNAVTQTAAFDAHVEEAFSELANSFVTRNGLAQTTGSSTDNAMSQAGVTNALLDYQTIANLVTSIDSASTDSQYPTAKLLYDLLLLKYNVSDGKLAIPLSSTPIEFTTLNEGIYYNATPNSIMLEINNVASGKSLAHNEVLVIVKTSTFIEGVWRGNSTYNSLKYTFASDKTTSSTFQYENTNNKVTSISAMSTNTQYPSAKLLYNELLKKYNITDGILIKELDTDEVRIGSLEDGIYLIKPVEEIKTSIYYNGATGLERILTFGAILEISSYNADVEHKVWKLFDGTGTYSQIFIGNTTSTSGSYRTVLTNADLKNNLTTTSENYALDARQGKILKDLIDEKQTEIDALYAQIPTATATDYNIHVEDSSNLPPKDFAMLGNATQETTSISGGDEYDSPSPDHPQDIHVVTGDNTVKVLGKNLLNIPENFQWTRMYTLSDVFIPAGTYHLTNAGATNSDNTELVKIRIGSASNTFTLSTSLDRTITLSNDVHVVYIYAKNNYQDSAGITATVKQLMLSKDGGAYEPYTEQTQLLSLNNIELAKIGDYTDRIYKQDGKWYVEKATTSILLKGTENWSKSSNTSVDRFILNYAGIPNRATGYCNYFKIEVGTNTGTIYTNQNQIIINFTSYGTTTLEQFKTWLSTHNTIVYYPLATPTTTEITDETLLAQLEAILAMHTNKNVTNAWIEPTGTNAQGGLTLTYYQDLQTIIGNLSNAIISLGGNV